jgi:hypothetical protein
MASVDELKERVSLRARQLARMGALGLDNLTSKRPAIEAGGPVVSLTSYGKRAATVSFAIESIAQGSLRPSRLILWLDERHLLERLPGSLRRLRERGVEILPTENYGPHKKYYPFVASQAAFDLPLVTADDDVLYPKHWLARLVEQHDKQPSAVHCYRARVMALNGETFAPYTSWRDCESTLPSHRHFSVGLAGVLFPPVVLHELRKRGDAFKSSCPRTDDIWLNLHAQRVGAKVQQVRAAAEHFMLLPGTQRSALLHTNMQGGNDAALGNVYGAADLQRLREAS